MSAKSEKSVSPKKKFKEHCLCTKGWDRRCTKTKTKTKNRTRCQENLIEISFRNVKEKLFECCLCVLKVGTADALLELAPFPKTPAQVRRRKFRFNLRICCIFRISFEPFSNMSQSYLIVVPKLSHGCSKW